MGPARDHGSAVASGMGQARGDLDFNSAIEPDRAALRNFPPRLLGQLLLCSYAIELLGIGLAYFVLAKIGLALASIHPSASPIWPPTGLALAAVMLGVTGFGHKILRRLGRHATTAGSIYTSSAIALGNTLECLIGGYLISRWSGGLRTFDPPLESPGLL